MNERHGRPWPTYLLGLAAIGTILAAVLVVGPPSQSGASVTRTVTAQRGVVQSTVSGSGNVQAAKQLDLGFKTNGVVSHIYVSQGQHVVQGQLLAELDPESAEVTLEQGRATLKTAEANLAREEETNGEGSTGSGATGRTSASAASVDYSTPAGDAATSPAGASEQGTGTSTAGTPGAGSSKQGASGKTHSTETSEAGAGGKAGETSGGGNGNSDTRVAPSSSKGAGAGSDSTLSSAARAANLASASAAVKSDKLAVQSDEEALANTKLYAPETGTLVSLSGEVGENVSATGTTKASSSNASESSVSGASDGASSAFGASSSAGNSGDSSLGSSSSSFAVLSDLSSMQLVVPLSESEIGEVKDGQPATITIEALESRKLAAEVVSIAMLPTSNSGVVSYDVTFELDQLTEGLRPGMSATAEVVIKQAEGVNVPSSAITRGEVTVLQAGKQVRKSVVSGLAGNSTTIVLSGLNAGEEVVLPATQTSSSASSLSSRFGGLGAGGLSGAGGLGGGAFRGAGGAGFAARAFGG
jgi:multidrug efflux pump subunit AcrA (membrane-fusion protein)